MDLALAIQMQFAELLVSSFFLLAVLESAQLPHLSGHLPPPGALGRLAFALSTPLFFCPSHKTC